MRKRRAPCGTLKVPTRMPRTTSNRAASRALTCRGSSPTMIVRRFTLRGLLRLGPACKFWHVDFDPPAAVRPLLERVEKFITEDVLPAERDVLAHGFDERALAAL